MIINFLFRIVANGLAIIAAAKYVPGVVYRYEPVSLLKIALIFALVNALLKPVLEFIFRPLIFLTIGFFAVVINLFLVWLATRLSPPQLFINGFVAYFWTMIIVVAFNTLVSLFKHKK